MQINTFWKIILKSIGLWLLINCVWVIPQFMSTLNFQNGEINWNSLVLVWLMSLITLIAYILVTRIFLFKTEWLLRILKLDQNFAEDRIVIEIPPKTILTVVITMIGGVYFIKSFPSLANAIFEFLKQKELIKDYHNAGWMIYFFCATLIGFWVMTNGKAISNYIWKNNAQY